MGAEVQNWTREFIHQKCEIFEKVSFSPILEI
jgi:hypothetical protein